MSDTELGPEFEEALVDQVLCEKTYLYTIHVQHSTTFPLHPLCQRAVLHSIRDYNWLSDPWEAQVVKEIRETETLSCEAGWRFPLTWNENQPIEHYSVSERGLEPEFEEALVGQVLHKKICLHTIHRHSMAFPPHL